MKTRSNDSKPACWLPRAACILLAASILACPAISGAQGRGGGKSDSGRSDSGRSDSGRGGGGGRSDSGRSDSGRSDSRRSDSGRSDSGRGGGGYQRESPAPRRDYTPAQRDTPRDTYRPPARSDDSSRRDTSPAPRDTYRRDTTPSQRDTNSPRRDDINADSRTNRDRIDAGRTNPRDDIRADRSTSRDSRYGQERSTDRTPRTDDRNSRTDRANPGQDRNRDSYRDNRPLPDHDYRGDAYRGGQRRDGTRDNVRRDGRDQGFDRRGSSRVEDVRPSRDRGYDIFSRSREGRRYNNGVSLRGGGYIPDRGIRRYFPGGYSYYPYYYPYYDSTLVYISPYSFYYGVCPPYFYRRHAFYHPPVSIWIDIPIYSGVDFRSWGGYDDDYYGDRDTYSDPSRLPDRDLANAVSDLREAFRFNNINLLANLTDPSVRIAVFLRGKYDYSLDANDYLDMTRDMFGSTETIDFDLQRIHRRSADVWVASGRQVYLNHDNQRRIVYLSFVLERVNGRWTITQVGTAPDRIEEPKN